MGVCRSVINSLEERLSHPIGNKTDGSTPYTPFIVDITLPLHFTRQSINIEIPSTDTHVQLQNDGGKFWNWKPDFLKEVGKEIKFLMRIFQQSNKIGKIETIGIKVFNRSLLTL